MTLTLTAAAVSGGWRQMTGRRTDQHDNTTEHSRLSSGGEHN